ncbi:MAG: hypothetical protein DYG94_10730 [Leptolyngbya sp. PLA3]|nr:MAG: hypothetical protein EDM82_08195 [Cyanobacteria bacterium CYA]MCE7969205.1 hypothetical protein [Leptolyngbya sp. PL-A3]
MTDQGVQTSTIGMRWARRMVIFAVLLLGLGAWASWDAFVVYPRRGQAFAEWAEWQYLLMLKDESRTDPGIMTRNAPVTDPQAELQRLRKDESARQRPSVAARYEWLYALSLVGKLAPENTNYAGVAPRQREEQLAQAWASRDKPAALRGYDIPSQYLMMIVGYGVGAYILFLLARVAITKYRWNPATRALTLPGGATITPADLAEVDKRKWDKFIVFLKIRPGVPSIGDTSVRVDTFRHGKVEEWILEMEREAFGPQEGLSPEAPPAEVGAPPAPESRVDSSAT